MPMLGDIFLNTVYEEKPDQSSKITDHPVEEGVNISDHVQKTPLTLKISGVVTGSDASTRLTKLRKYTDKGARLKYVYRNKFDNMVIESFDTTHDADVLGGFKYSMTLKQIRVAKPVILVKLPQTKPKTNKGQQQPSGSSPKKFYVVKSGDTLWDIAEAKLGDALRWREIYNKNKKVIGSDPDLIYPGQRYILP